MLIKNYEFLERKIGIMSEAVKSANDAKFIALQEKLKAYAKTSPTDKGILDQAYHNYLRRCAELYTLSKKLNECVYLELTPEEMAETLLEIETSIDKIIG